MLDADLYVDPAVAIINRPAQTTVQTAVGENEATTSNAPTQMTLQAGVDDGDYLCLIPDKVLVGSTQTPLIRAIRVNAIREMIMSVDGKNLPRYQPPSQWQRQRKILSAAELVLSRQITSTNYLLRPLKGEKRVANTKKEGKKRKLNYKQYMKTKRTRIQQTIPGDEL